MVISALWACTASPPTLPPPALAPEHVFHESTAPLAGTFVLDAVDSQSLDMNVLEDATRVEITVDGDSVSLCSTWTHNEIEYGTPPLQFVERWGASGTLTASGSAVRVEFSPRTASCDPESPFDAPFVLPCIRGTLDGHATLACAPDPLFASEYMTLPLGVGTPLVYLAQPQLHLQRRSAESDDWTVTW